MAMKIITNENGEEVITKGKKAITERRIRKYQKYVSVATVVALMLVVSSLTVFATTDNTAPDNVNTATMGSLSTIIWWVVRVAVLAIGGIPAIIKIVQGQADENPRDRNAGIATLVITAAVFGASFAIQNLIGL